MNILITGGAGYVGAKLTSTLLKEGHKIKILDLMLYGDKVFDFNNNLELIKGDIRNIDLLKKVIPSNDIVIHLACISNDPSFELNPKLGKSINYDAFEPLVKISKQNNVKRFIYASSSSVYGIKKVKDVHEDMSLDPLTDYSKFKVECEKILSKYNSDDFTTVTLRPATVCGYSRRQRLDVIVNILTNLAYHKKIITVFGGNQLRPNININDMVNAYVLLTKIDKNKISDKIYNVGYENQKVIHLAETVRNVIGKDVKIITEKTNDNRSYHINSDRIKDELGFLPENSIKDAVIELKEAFEKKLLINTLYNENYFNIKKMQSLNLK